MLDCGIDLCLRYLSPDSFKRHWAKLLDMVHAWMPLVEEFVELNDLQCQGLEELAGMLVKIVFLDGFQDHVVGRKFMYRSLLLFVLLF